MFHAGEHGVAAAIRSCPTSNLFQGPKDHFSGPLVTLAFETSVGRRTDLAVSAIGRKRTLVSAVFRVSKRPLSGKADIQPETLKFRVSSGRYALKSRRWADKMARGR